MSVLGSSELRRLAASSDVTSTLAVLSNFIRSELLSLPTFSPFPGEDQLPIILVFLGLRKIKHFKTSHRLHMLKIGDLAGVVVAHGDVTGMLLRNVPWKLHKHDIITPLNQHSPKSSPLLPSKYNPKS